MIVFTAAETETQLDVAGQVPNLDDMAKTAEEVGQNISHFNLMDFMTRYFPVMVNVAVTILVIILIWVIGKKITRIVLRLFEKTAEINHFDISVTKFLSILIRWGMYMLIICTILNYLNIGTASLVALLGTAGLAIGMSLQGSLANFAGSIILLVMKPFKVGDYISTSAGEGTVEIIGLIYTTLISVDGREVHIPNGSLANSNITNVSARPERLVSLKVGISYSSDIRKAKMLIENMMKECEYRLKDSDVKVFVSNLGSSSVDLEGRCSVATENYWAATWYFAERIKEIYDDEGIEIPFSQLDVHVRNGQN